MTGCGVWMIVAALQNRDIHVGPRDLQLTLSPRGSLSTDMHSIIITLCEISALHPILDLLLNVRII